MSWVDHLRGIPQAKMDMGQEPAEKKQTAPVSLGRKGETDLGSSREVGSIVRSPVTLGMEAAPLFYISGILIINQRHLRCWLCLWRLYDLYFVKQQKVKNKKTNLPLQ